MLDRQWQLQFERDTRKIELGMLFGGLVVAVAALFGGIWLGNRNQSVVNNYPVIERVIVLDSSP